MWVIELNFAGRQFTHRVPDRRQRLYRLATRTVGMATGAAAQPAGGVRTLQTVPATKTANQAGFDAKQHADQRRRGDARARHRRRDDRRGAGPQRRAPRLGVLPLPRGQESDPDRGAARGPATRSPTASTPPLIGVRCLSSADSSSSGSARCRRATSARAAPSSRPRSAAPATRPSWPRIAQRHLRALARRAHPRVRRRRFRRRRGRVAGGHLHRVAGGRGGAVPVDPQRRALRQVASQMEFLIKSREFVRRNGLPTGDR